jgi:hypothetical protein
MHKFWANTAIDLVIMAVCIFVFRESLADVLGELLWFYATIAGIGVILFIYIAWALTRAMNPKVTKNV